MTAQFGRDYTMTFARAFEAANHEKDLARYSSELEAAVEILILAGWTRKQSQAIALGHATSVYNAIGEDLQDHVDAGGTLPGQSDRERVGASATPNHTTTSADSNSTAAQHVRWTGGGLTRGARQ
ncbi:hypothetical protein [Nocardia arizonensis]|nr:hypothetical protein [Nocardia arizonensis]